MGRLSYLLELHKAIAMFQMRYVHFVVLIVDFVKPEHWYAATFIEEPKQGSNLVEKNIPIYAPLSLVKHETNNSENIKKKKNEEASPSLENPIYQNGFQPTLSYPKRHLFNLTNDGLSSIRITPFRRKIVRKRCPTGPRKKKQLIVNEQSPKKRFLDLFQVVEFEHVSCTSSSGLEGVCLHEYECASAGGIAMGSCADEYGTCCVTLLLCDSQSSATMGWFTNPGFPSPSSERISCSVTLNKASKDISQLRLDFTNFELLPPTAGTCEQDQFVVSGQNVNNIIPILCGVNNDQHVYVEVGDASGPIYLTVQTVTAENRLFSIKVTQLKVTDELAAPSNCLQYLTESEGYLESFNYRELSNIEIAREPTYFNNLNYAMCIKRAPYTCSITYTNSDVIQIVNYDENGLPVIPPGQAGVEIFNCPTDWLLMSGERLCGDKFNDGSVLQDFSLDAPVTDTAGGPIVVWFRSDGGYVGRGFKLQYQQNTCLTQ